MEGTNLQYSCANIKLLSGQKLQKSVNQTEMVEKEQKI